MMNSYNNDNAINLKFMKAIFSDEIYKKVRSLICTFSSSVLHVDMSLMIALTISS